MAEIRRRPRAQRDAVEIWHYVARDNPAAADRMIDRFDAALALLSANPKAGRERPELVSGLRSFPVGNYILYYFETATGLELVRVLSGFRDLDPDSMM